MEAMQTNREFNLYRDIKLRTEGEIYLGVVGPVRTGKSTFIKRFMDLLVLPFMENEHEKQRAVDELPQSGVGKTITTTEPKFIPKEAADIVLKGGLSFKVRLVDCVGFLVPGAAGALEDESQRMVKTPWFEESIPFAKAAEIGTEKVIRDHSTIGIAVFSDGSFGDFSRNDFLEAEEKTIKELKNMQKPFLVILNSARPYSEETMKQVGNLKDKYKVPVIPVNCEQMKEKDVLQVLEEALYEFPISEMEFYMPKWVEMLKSDHPLKMALIEKAGNILRMADSMRSFMEQDIKADCPYIENLKVDRISLSDGVISITMEVNEKYYYELLSELLGDPVGNEYELMEELKSLARMKEEYILVQDALNCVRQKGYGVVTPERSEIHLEEPEVIRHGNKFGVKIKAESPSIHMIRATVNSEIAPIVGTEEQAKDLIAYIKESEEGEEGIWNTNIFGKTVEQLIRDGINSKVSMMGEECQVKLQDTMQKIVNESNGRMICIII